MLANLFIGAMLSLPLPFITYIFWIQSGDYEMWFSVKWGCGVTLTLMALMYTFELLVKKPLNPQLPMGVLLLGAAIGSILLGFASWMQKRKFSQSDSR